MGRKSKPVKQLIIEAEHALARNQDLLKAHPCDRIQAPKTSFSSQVDKILAKEAQRTSLTPKKRAKKKL